MKRKRTGVISICFLALTGLVLIFCSGCNDDSAVLTTETRSFYMGFTPWPWAATTEAIDSTYSFINVEGDLVAHHFQQGIPYTASNTLDFSTWHVNVQNEINDRINKTARGRVLYLAIDPLNAGRNDLADLWESSPNMTRPAPWNTRRFSDPEFITAYTNVALAVIERFRTQYGVLPQWFNYGTEVSELMLNNPSRYDDFVVFAQTVYTSLKAAYPELRLVVSIALKTPDSTAMQTVTTGFACIRDWVDVVGISTYGYAFYEHSDKGNPDNLPAQWLSQIKTIAPEKPYMVTETGWIAQDLDIAAYGLSVDADENSQYRYLEKLFTEANGLNAQGLILFTYHDYDTLWTDTLGSDNLSAIWKDTGLVGETHNERRALTLWRQWAARSRR